MRTFQVSNEMYEQLKNFVVDPFADTPEVVIGRLIEIVNKAKNRWSPFDVSGDSQDAEPSVMSRSAQREFQEEEPVVVL
jgi:hypothetical protein